MTDTPTPNKFAKWIRPLVSGLLSGGIVASYYYYSIEVLNEAGLIASGLFVYGFEVPLEFIYNITGIWGGVMGVFLSWFLAGAVITLFVRRNLPAFGSWILLYVLCTILSLTVS